MLGIPTFQLKTKSKRITQKSQKNDSMSKKKKNETTTTQISINNLKMGPRAYIGHKLQI